LLIPVMFQTMNLLLTEMVTGYIHADLTVFGLVVCSMDVS